MQKIDTVCAVVVTYNRINCLLPLLAALEEQSKKIEMIVLINNCSTDATHEVLQESGYIQKGAKQGYSENERNGIRYLYYLNEKNTGGSGGFAKGMEIASEQDCGYIWVMDDDVLPEKDCLERLLAQMNDDVQVVVPYRTGEDFTDRICTNLDLKSIFKMGVGSRKTLVMPPFTEKTYYVKDCTFEGPLFTREVVRKIGLPYENYFILKDDTEYAVRAQKHTKVLLVMDAVLHRQLPIGREEKRKKYGWKHYYLLRNDVIFLRRNGETFGAKYISPLLEWIWYFFIQLLRGRFWNVKVVNKAFMDAHCGREGKQVEPGAF